MRVYCATFYNESNTFSPFVSGLADFTEMDLARRGSKSFQTAFEPVFAAGGTVVGDFNRGAVPGGTVTRTAYETLRSQLLDDLEALCPVDLVVLNLHGAMVADGYPDCEGDVLRRVRVLVGRQVTVAASLDPHSHLTALMLENADILVAYREYPHTDESETFAEAVRLGLRTALGEVRPAMSVQPCGQIDSYLTKREPMRGIVERMRGWERNEGVLAVSLIHGFPWGDVAEMGTKALVLTDGRPELGRKIARELACDVISVRGHTTAVTLPFEDALAEALRPPGPVIVADMCDNPGGGAAGDSTFLLRPLLTAGFPCAFGPLWDPMVVALAHAAGPGALLNVRLGGKTSAASGDPIDLTVRVEAVAEELRVPGVGGYDVSYGAAAALRAGDVEIVVTTVREQAMDPAMFADLGISLRDKQAIVVKSSQHFFAAYGPLANKVLYASSPGSLATDYRSIPYRIADRGLWPLAVA